MDIETLQDKIEWLSNAMLVDFIVFSAFRQSDWQWLAVLCIIIGVICSVTMCYILFKYRVTFKEASKKRYYWNLVPASIYLAFFLTVTIMKIADF